MAAIRAALRRVADHCHTGRAVARGLRAPSVDVSIAYPGWWAFPHYSVIALDSGGLHIVHDCGEPDEHSGVVVDRTVRVSRSIFVGDHVTLSVHGNNEAMWAPTNHGGHDETTRVLRSDLPALVTVGSLWLDRREVGSRLCVVKVFAQHVLVYDMDMIQLYPVSRLALIARCVAVGESWNLMLSSPVQPPYGSSGDDDGS